MSILQLTGQPGLLASGSRPMGDMESAEIAATGPSGDSGSWNDRLSVASGRSRTGSGHVVAPVPIFC